MLIYHISPGSLTYHTEKNSRYPDFPRPGGTSHVDPSHSRFVTVGDERWWLLDSHDTRSSRPSSLAWRASQPASDGEKWGSSQAHLPRGWLRGLVTWTLARVFCWIFKHGWDDIEKRMVGVSGPVGYLTWDSRRGKCLSQFSCFLFLFEKWLLKCLRIHNKVLSF